jgi:NADP-dependent 3-hydroxy acid dehydrogenase YdfG
MKLAFITGASSGVGAAAARHLAAAGYRVILVARRRAPLEQLARSIGAAAVAAPCDAADGEALLSLAGQIRATYGTPDLIVNCAGAGQWKFIEDTVPDEALHMMDAPYHCAFNTTHAFMDGMLARRSGVIIHVNSPAAFFPWPSSTGYAAARWALRGLHQALCQDLHGTDVSSCHLVLARVDSAYFDHNPDSVQHVPRLASTVRTLSADECGRLIARLAARPRRELLYPFMLRCYGWGHRLAPAMVSWLLRISGTRH